MSDGDFLCGETAIAIGFARSIIWLQINRFKNIRLDRVKFNAFCGTQSATFLYHQSINY